MVNGKRPLTTTITPATKRKRTAPANRATVEAYVLFYGVRCTVYGFLNPRNVLYIAAEDSIKLIIRGVMDRVRSRWVHNLPVGLLETTTVTVVDDSVVIPAEGSGPEDKDFAGKTRSFTISIVGSTGSWPDRDHFLQLLTTPGLKIEQYDCLYYHKFLQPYEELACWPALSVQYMKHKEVKYFGVKQPWERAYNHWEKKKKYPGQINIRQAAKSNHWAYKVYRHRKYPNTRSQRLKYVRNVWYHLNDYRVKAGLPIYSNYTLGILIEELVPGVANRYYQFLWELRLFDLDFYKLRLHFKP